MLKLKFTNSKNIITQFPSIGPKANPYNTYSSSPENIVKKSFTWNNIHTKSRTKQSTAEKENKFIPTLRIKSINMLSKNGRNVLSNTNSSIHSEATTQRGVRSNSIKKEPSQNSLELNKFLLCCDTLKECKGINK
jgi:hypothetical protein